MKAFAKMRRRERIPYPLVGVGEGGVEPSRSDSRSEAEI